MKQISFLSFLVVLACAEPQEVAFEPEIEAEAVLYSLATLGDNQYARMENEIGSATFAQDGNVVKLQITLTGMTPNTFKAVHIHHGTVENPGRHWNRGSLLASCDSLSMGNFWGRPFIGDVGNVRIDENGEGVFSIRTDLWRINSGDEKDLVGLPIIVHEMPQDFQEECDPNHDHTHMHMNPKIGGGVISLTSGGMEVGNAIDLSEEIPSFLICR